MDKMTEAGQLHRLMNASSGHKNYTVLTLQHVSDRLSAKLIAVCNRCKMRMDKKFRTIIHMYRIEKMLFTCIGLAMWSQKMGLRCYDKIHQWQKYL